MCSVCKLQLKSDFTDGFFTVNQLVGCFFHAEIHGIVEQAQSGKFVDNAIDVVAVVIELTGEFIPGNASVLFFYQMADAGENQGVGILFQRNLRAVKVFRIGKVGYQ